MPPLLSMLPPANSLYHVQLARPVLSRQRRSDARLGTKQSFMYACFRCELPSWLGAKKVARSVATTVALGRAARRTARPSRRTHEATR